MQSYPCFLYVELTERDAAFASNGSAGKTEMILRRTIELPFVPVPGIELNFGAPVDHGGRSHVAIEVAIHSVSYKVGAGCFEVFCNPARDFQDVQYYMQDETGRDQIIADCWQCGFQPVPLLSGDGVSFEVPDRL